VRQLGDDADVGASAPLAVGDHVEPGLLLQRDRVAHRGVEARVAHRWRQRRAVVDQVLDEARARQRADHRGGEARRHAQPRHRRCARSRSSCVSISR
jgi:hypothetical protein